jgi:hypothetical protein
VHDDESNEQQMIDLAKHDSSSLDKINTREAGSRVLTNDISNGALTSPDSCVPTLLHNYTTLGNCEFVVKGVRGITVYHPLASPLVIRPPPWPFCPFGQ